jgi:FAD-dependent urate hydroxylase
MTIVLLFSEDLIMSTRTISENSQLSVTVACYDAVIIGAGPYGLSTTAHLLERGLNVAVFGTPLQLWRESMPKNMLLRSYWWATNLSDPERRCGLDRYFQLRGLEAPDPLPIETFIDYGLWFQKQMVPNVDETYVASIEHVGDHFKLFLVNGRIVHSPIVVMAPGLHYYAYRPAEYDHLSSDRVSHTSDHHTFDRFSGKKVVVIGGGQSGLETAALLHENGAAVEVIARRPIRWLQDSKSLENRPFIERIKNPKAATATGWYHWGIEHLPYTFRKLPRDIKDRQIRNRFGPAGAGWLKPRLLNLVPIHEGIIEGIRETGNDVTLMLTGNRVVRADHVILATGYQVDIRKLPMFTSPLISNIQTYQNAPILNNHFESTLSGLYFVGISSVSSFGPFYRFVAGTHATAGRISSSVVKKVKHA